MSCLKKLARAKKILYLQLGSDASEKPSDSRNYIMVLFMNIELRTAAMLVAFLHFMLLVYGIYLTVVDMAEEADVVTNGEIFYIVCHVLAHLLLSFSLGYGAAIGKPVFAVPWLLSCFPVIVIATMYAVYYSRVAYFLQLVFNMTFVCFLWYIWFIVYRYARSCSK